MSCPDCFTGHVHDGTPRGHIDKLHGLDTYVADPPSGHPAKGIVVIIPDALGWAGVNVRLVADYYASTGDFLVYVPDFMDGTGAPAWLLPIFPRLTETATLLDWVWKPYHVFWCAYGIIPFLVRNRFSIAWPRVRAFFTSLRVGGNSASGPAASTTTTGPLPIGVVGFCWGGKHAAVLSHAKKGGDVGGMGPNGRPLVDAVLLVHPGGLELPRDVDDACRPTSLAIGDQDMVLGPQQVEGIRKVWEGEEWKKRNPGVETEVVVYEGTGHGFGVRADPKNKEVMRQAREVEDQAVKWFGKHFAEWKE